MPDLSPISCQDVVQKGTECAQGCYYSKSGASCWQRLTKIALSTRNRLMSHSTLSAEGPVLHKTIFLVQSCVNFFFKKKGHGDEYIVYVHIDEFSLSCKIHSFLLTCSHPRASYLNTWK